MCMLVRLSNASILEPKRLIHSKTHTSRITPVLDRLEVLSNSCSIVSLPLTVVSWAVALKASFAVKLISDIQQPH